jgi:hypothetical protein
MEEKKKLNITFESTLDNIIELNPSFDKGILKIAYTGLNRNNSFISKDTFEKDINTMFLCPVVANYSIDSNQIGSHDIALKPDTDGNLEMINVTQPVGVIPESAQWYWENINDNGAIHEYLCTEAILWKRQPCYQKIKENGITSESMEIDVNEAHMVNGYYQIDDFCFTAFCLLGSAEPCFESASLQVFSKENFKEQYTQMMKEFKETFSNNQSQSSLEVDDINNTFSQENKKEEEILNEDKNETVVSEVVQEVVAEIPTEVVEPIVNTAVEEVVPSETTEFTETVDEPVIDYKAEYEKINADYSTLQTEFSTYKETYKTAESDVETLRTYQVEKLATERKDAEDTIFAQFTELNDTEDFKTLKENAKNYDLEALTDKCFSIKGRLNSNFSLNTSKPKSTVKIAVDTISNKTDPYGGLFETYGNKEN